MPMQHLTAHLLEIALDRSKALGVELTQIKQRQHPPTGPDLLIDLAIQANSKISEDISNMLSSLPTLPSTPDRRIEIFLRGKTNLLSFIHASMQCIEGANIQSCPGAFIVTIRRMLMRQLRRRRSTNFDFIVKASHAYNYMIWSIHDEMNEVFLEAGYTNLIVNFPVPFFIIECPISERRNIPIHCIFAHEVGHVWYSSSSLPNRLLPVVQTPRDNMQQKIIKANWVEELTADAIALCLFGPAFLYSSIYFAGPFCSMSGASETHPPDGIRIQFMCNMLLNSYRRGGLAYKSSLNPTNLHYLEQWQSYASSSVRTMSVGGLYRPIISGIMSTLPEIMRGAKDLTGTHRYNIRTYSEDIPALRENIADGIPPNELPTDFSAGTQRIVQAESILNAGWDYLISGDSRYAELLGIEDKWKVTNRLFDLVSKGLEYSEMQRQWSNQT